MGDLCLYISPNVQDHRNLQAEAFDLLKSQSLLKSSQITISARVFNRIPTSTLSVLHFSSSPTLTMRFSAELVALVAISSFGLVAAAPVPEAEADPAPLFIGGQYYGGGFE